jgi:two-component system, cell cycle sensor histidine kinase and response regulator CckA
MMDAAIPKRTLPLGLILIVAAVAMGIASVGLWSYRTQQQHLRQAALQELAAVAHLKVDQIVKWRKERLGDAAVLMEEPLFSEEVAKWMSTHQSGLRHNILSRFKSLQEYYGYNHVALVDIDGKILLNHTGGLPSLAETTLQALKIALRNHKPCFTDIHFPPENAVPHLDVIAPLFLPQEESQEPIGAVIMGIEARQFLYPLIQSWPVPSATAETLLVSREGDQVLFLNDLRHRPDTALKLRLPVSRADLPAARAVLGARGVLEGHDYRGIRVLSALEPIPDSPWFLVAKVDAEEAFAGVRSTGRLIIGLSVALFLGACLVTLFLWQRTQKEHYRELYEAETRRQALLRHFEYLVKDANDIILLADETRRLIEVNDRAVAAYGYTREELLALTLDDLIAPDDFADYQKRLKEVTEEGSLISEANHRRKDGTQFPVEVSERFMVVEGKRYLQVIARDITERKRVEEALRQSELSYRTIFDSATDAIFLHDAETGRILEVNEAACRLWGYSCEEMKALDLAQLSSGTAPYTEKEAMEWVHKGIEEGPQLFEWIARRRDGTPIWFENNLKRIEIEGKERVLVLGRDTTERKKGEEELVLRNKIARAFLAAASDAEIYSDVLEIVLEFMKSAYGVFGYLDEYGSLVVPSMTRGIWTKMPGCP